MSALENGFAAMDWSRPASDVSNAAAQDLIADSLIDDSGARPLSSFNFDAASEELDTELPFDYEREEAEQEPAQMSEEQIDALVDGALGPGERFQTEDGPQEAQPQEITPEVVENVVQELGQAVESYGLADEGGALRLIHDLGGDIKTADVKTFDYNLCGMVVSAAKQAAQGVTLENLSGVHPLLGERFAQDFFTPLMGNAKGVDAQAFANVANAGAVNLVHTLNEHGLDADIAAVTDPRMARWFVTALHQSIGNHQPLSDERVMAEALMFGRAFEEKYQRLMANLAQQPEPKASRSKKRSGKGSSKFSTNTDIFDDDTMEFFAANHGRL